jgi:hypothetical protein
MADELTGVDVMYVSRKMLERARQCLDETGDVSKDYVMSLVLPEMCELDEELVPIMLQARHDAFDVFDLVEQLGANGTFQALWGGYEHWKESHEVLGERGALKPMAFKAWLEMMNNLNSTAPEDSESNESMDFESNAPDKSMDLPPIAENKARAYARARARELCP